MTSPLPSQVSDALRKHVEPPVIDRKTPKITIWVLLGVSFCFLLPRLYARWRAFKRLYWDDALVIFAWALMLAVTIVTQVFADAMYKVSDILSGRVLPSPQFSIWSTQTGRAGLAIIILSITSLWAIKISFLVFFKRLGTEKIRSLRIHWWIVTILTILTYFANFPHIEYVCMVGSFEELVAYQCHIRKRTTFFSMRFNCALDIVTDLLIMTIPFIILWRVQISKLKKAALMGIFSLVVLTIVFAILRVHAITGPKALKQRDTMWLSMWSVIETSVAIIVACLGSFRVLFTASSRSSDNAACRGEAMRHISPGQSWHRIPETDRNPGLPWTNDVQYITSSTERQKKDTNAEILESRTILVPSEAHTRI